MLVTGLPRSKVFNRRKQSTLVSIVYVQMCVHVMLAILCPNSHVLTLECVLHPVSRGWNIAEIPLPEYYDED